MEIFYIDLFSGAGGTTTGIHLSDKNIKVVACVNHDATAIESHKANHPDCLHFVEDVRDLKVVAALQNIVTNLRIKHPDCKIIIWASLECTNYSKAKGGLPRNADSRTLAYALYSYIEKLSPDYIDIENVREFMSWGPLDEKGKPLSKYRGIDYIHWIKKMCSYGYWHDWRILNSADFGAYTSRERYFCQFAKLGLPIHWPIVTHAKKIKDVDLFNYNLKSWLPVKDVLDLSNEGSSIFKRKKPLVEATLKRIYAGLIKFIAHGDESFLISYYGNSKSARSVLKPSPTLTTKDRVSLIQTQFIDNQYGKGKATSLEKPNGTLTSSPKQNLITVKPWLMNTSFNNVGSSIDQPAQTILASRKHHYLINPQFNNKGASIEKPCFTLIARMDKKPPYLIEIKEGDKDLEISESDSETMKKIKLFMSYYKIFDIKMRMLNIPELLKIQGFPDNYQLYGTLSEQKKQIGNAVVPIMSKVIASSKALALTRQFKEAI